MFLHDSIATNASLYTVLNQFIDDFQKQVNVEIGTIHISPRINDKGQRNIEIELNKTPDRFIHKLKKYAVSLKKYFT